MASLKFPCKALLIIIIGPTSPRFCASLRWWGKTLQNITAWEPGYDRVIEISQGHGPSISVRVKKFIPEPDDQLAYRWLPNGVARPYGFANIEQPGSVQLAMPPYAIANIGEAASAFRKYIDSNVLTYLNLVLDTSEPISFRTFHMAYRYAQTHSVSNFLIRMRNDVICYSTDYLRSHY